MDEVEEDKQSVGVSEKDARDRLRWRLRLSQHFLPLEIPVYAWEKGYA